jgi:hypothetical protein
MADEADLGNVLEAKMPVLRRLIGLSHAGLGGNNLEVLTFENICQFLRRELVQDKILACSWA